VHAALEISITGEHRAGDHIAGLDGLGDFRLQGTGVADAVVNADCPSYERMNVVDGKIEYSSFPRLPPVDDRKIQSRQAVRVLRRAIVLWRLGNSRWLREPVPDSEFSK